MGESCFGNIFYWPQAGNSVYPERKTLVNKIKGSVSDHQ
jgi:hypothetical protein